VLEGLALRHASGVLEIDGNPGGAIYLDQGHITFARASWTPGLLARLRGMLRPSGELRDLLLGEDQPDRDLGALLVERHCIARDELQAILRSVVVDAVIVLTVPLAEEVSVAGIRFEPSQAHWARSFSRLRVDSVRAEAVTRAERMARCDLAYDARLELRDIDDASAVVTREQWVIACEIDGTSSVKELARTCGLALYETIESLGDLVRAGLCVPCLVEDPPLPPGGPGSEPVAFWPAEVSQILPRRQPGASAFRSGPGSGDDALPGVAAEPGEAPATQPPADPLRRVLDGLRRIN
jgi:hypothetical protein